mmetsp:Transcript_108201/g.316452  ORF Transcript_108201/g.316452 Transcript_108201/m.316452 type:complete len:768 (+) Transcript_108201:86-2389(+)
MKFSLSILLVAVVVFAALPSASGARALRAGGRAGAGNDRTITRVVRLLQQMLDDSKAEGEQDRTLYAKHKCYCDDNTLEKTESIKTLTKQIGLLENDIQQLQGSNSLLSSESAQLQAEMDANEQARTEAGNLRTSANTAFLAEETDLSAAITQLGQAVDVLAAIGADQSQQAAADHSTFLANYSSSLLNLRSSVKQALLAADTFLSPAAQSKTNAFLQAPFTGTYTAQSGEIMGILRQMKETFESNLEAARTAEQNAVTAHSAFMTTKQNEWNTMKASFDGKQTTLGSNDGSLSEKKNSLGQAVQQKTDAEDFLAQLGPMCETKTQEYEQRTQLRASEEAAITEAIAILDNDKAFETFGRVAATTTGATGFVQLSSIKRHQVAGQVGTVEAAQRRKVAHLLTQAARSQKSSKLARVAVLLSTGNPFEKVLQAIENMKQLIVEEGRVDTEQKNWCTTETGTNTLNLQAKEGQISTLQGDITTLETNIHDPATGLKAMIEQTETSLTQNSESQSTETATRRQENTVYQQQVTDANEAAMILGKAIVALERYYATDSGSSQLQLGRRQESVGSSSDDPAPPATWGNYTGQSTQGANVISILKFVQSETQTEENALHTAEQTAQTSYEDSMAGLKTTESDLQTNLVQFKADLATAERDLLAKREELDKTDRERISIQRYLDSIKPGCDFITTNFRDRETNRATETQALDQAVTLITATPAYTAATAAANLAALGSCQSLCAASEAHVDCKACLAGVSVPGYCAGHQGTAGC